MCFRSDNITKDVLNTRFVTAPVKSNTETSMEKSTVLPVGSSSRLFLYWGTNSSLNLKYLRLKATALLSLALVLRPSDIAPTATLFDASPNSVHSFCSQKTRCASLQMGKRLRLFVCFENDIQRIVFEGFSFLFFPFFVFSSNMLTYSWILR